MEMTTSYLDIYEIEPRFTYRQATTRQHCGTQVYFSEGAQVMQLISFTKHLLNQDFFCLYYKVKKLLK